MPFKPANTRFWHYDFQIGGRRFHGSTGTENHEEAKAIEAQARVEAKAAPDLRGIFTLAEAIGTYWADISQHQTCSGVTLGHLQTRPKSATKENSAHADEWFHIGLVRDGLDPVDDQGMQVVLATKPWRYGRCRSYTVH